MRLKRRILLEKIDKLDKLSKAERKRALSDPEHLVSIGENSAFKDVEELYPRTPSWESIRGKVLKRAARIEAQARSRHLSGLSTPTWYARAAFAVILVAIVWVIAMLMPNDQPLPYDQVGAASNRVVVHYADSRNLFGHAFNP